VTPPSTSKAAPAFDTPPPPQETVTDHHGCDKPAGHRPPRSGRGTSPPSPRPPSYGLHADGVPPNAAPVFPPKLSFPGDIPTSPQRATLPTQPDHMQPQSVPLPRARRAPTSFRPHRSQLRQCLAFALLHPGACGAIPLLHVPAAVSADFRLIVDTGSPENIHNNAADLFDTSPSDKVFITADGTRVPATCVGKLPLILTDTSGCQSFYILHEVHAVPSFEYEYTLLSVANLVSNGASVQINPDCECIVLPAANRFTAARTIPLRKAADGIYLVDAAIADELDVRKPGIHVLGAFRDPHTFQHLAALPADKLATAIFRRLPFGAEKLRRLADTASDVPRGIARGTPPPRARVGHRQR